MNFNKYLEKILKRIEYFFWQWKYDTVRMQSDEIIKFTHANLDYELGKKKLDGIIKEIGRTKYENDQSARSIHWIIFACLSDHSPILIRRILEIGTFDGETTSILSKLFPNSEIVTVDLPENDPILRSSYARHDDLKFRDFKIKQTANLEEKNIKALSVNSFFLPREVDGQFDLIWVDGGHLYPEIAWDLCNAYNFCSPNGFIMVDDVIMHPRGFRDAYVSPSSFKVIKYLTLREQVDEFYFLKRNSARWSSVPRRRKFVALLRKII
jgi:predicted O-methyltransferase YrrM